MGSSATNTLTIKPASGVAATISGTVAGNSLITFNGADYVIFDGLNTGGSSLAISNLSAAATAGTSTIQFNNDATNNKVTNCNVYGSAIVPLATNGGIIYFGAGTTSGNDYNTISYCKIGPAGANLPSKCIYGNGSNTNATIVNSNISIDNCEIYDFFLTGGCAGVYALAGNTEWSITNNKIYQSAARTFTATGTLYGIYFSSTTYGNNVQIIGNTIGYANNGGTGTLTILGSTIAGTFQGISLGAQLSASTACNVSNNIISDISLTSSSGTFYGIYNSANTININSNTIRNIATTTNNWMIGIYNFSASTLSENGNIINNFTRKSIYNAFNRIS
jgi:hypothetical protein